MKNFAILINYYKNCGYVRWSVIEVYYDEQKGIWGLKSTRIAQLLYSKALFVEI